PRPARAPPVTPGSQPGHGGGTARTQHGRKREAAMRYAIVTETYPPEVNGVALTVQALELGLRRAGHDVDLVRPRQDIDGMSLEGGLLVPGASLPRYPGLRFGLPAPIRLGRHWQANRPDAIYIATEGPLGWSALRCARRLGIPVASGFHTRFDEYLPDYGAAWLQAAALRWMRRFHNQADATLVPSRELQAFLRSEEHTSELQSRETLVC